MGEELDEPDQVLASASVVMELDDNIVPEIVHHPSFRYWVQASRRTTSPDSSVHRPRVAGSLTSIVWAIDAICRSSRVEWIVLADRDGGIRVIPFGFYIELGKECAGRRVRIRSNDGVIALKGMDGAAIGEIASDLDKDGCVRLTSHSTAIKIVEFEHIFCGEVPLQSRDPWLRVKLTGTNQRRDGTDFFAVDDGLYANDRPAPHIGEAAEFMADACPDAARDICTFTKVIVPIWLPKTQRGAFTVSSRQGAIFIGEANVDAVCDMILHENAHVKLRQVQLLDTLLVDPLDEDVKVSVPWRPDPRPMPGVLEGLFVFSHVAEFNLRRIVRSAELDSKALRLSHNLGAAMELVENSAKLTSEGEIFLGELKGWIQSIEDRSTALDPKFRLDRTQQTANLRS